MSKSRLHARISGTVQGVSFRYYTTQTARDLGITGWVRNNPDGSVEVVAEGEQSDLEKLFDFLHKGSPAARVQNVESDWQSAMDEFQSFTVKYHR